MSVSKYCAPFSPLYRGKKGESWISGKNSKSDPAARSQNSSDFARFCSKSLHMEHCANANFKGFILAVSVFSAAIPCSTVL